MGKQTLVMIFGVWVAVQSFLGLPLLWDRIVLAFLGIAILALGILLRYDALVRGGAKKESETLAENTPIDAKEGERGSYEDRRE